MAGISNDGQKLCTNLALWNGKDAIIYKYLFGLTDRQGNDGSDVKEN
jgi:hypothetical protein